MNPRTPLTPETIDRTPIDEKINKNQLTPTITEETEQDDQLVGCKSSLSLPVEPPAIGPIERDRRKLSVQGLMAFAERRKSSSTFADMRKMSVSNGDSIHIRSPCGTNLFFFLTQFHFKNVFSTFFRLKFSNTWSSSNSQSTVIKNDKIRRVLGRR